MANKETQGLTVKKDENFSEWYTQVILKAELADYTDVSGCIVFRPNSYRVWEEVQNFLDEKFKESGAKNAYFPLFIPEALLTKESDHVEGFTPEVAWVTHAGETKLNERLAIRPTSETIMYQSYKNWIRSHNDLPMRLNQWNSVVRWEFKHAMPFIRTREFLWQEGHSAFATKEEADAEVKEMLEYYKQAFEELLAVPVIPGKKSDIEKFAGADYSLSVETFLPVNKAIQGATSHSLGQNFSKAFDITFQDKNSKKRYVWQNSWGFSTRALGIMIIMHGDDSGLIMPPKVAPLQTVIVPILFEGTKREVLKKAKEIKKELSEFRVMIDDRDYSPGWKFNEWELKGVPIRIEIGPRDLKNKQVVLVRRDTGKKETVKFSKVKSRVKTLLEKIQDNLYNTAKKRINKSLVTVKTWTDFKKAVEEKKWIKAPHCADSECEILIKDKTNGVKTNNIPFKQKKVQGKCVHCNKKAKYYALFAKSY